MNYFFRYIKYLWQLDYFYYKQYQHPLIRFIDYTKLNIKKIIRGTIIYQQCIRNNSKYICNEEFEQKLMYLLLPYDLHIFPRSVYYPNVARLCLTKACNFNCSYCYQQKESSLMSLDQIQENILFLKKHHIRNIALIGGEIFLFPNLIYNTIKKCNENGITVYSLTTNGFWCEDKQKCIKYLKMLCELGFEGYIKVSLGKEHLRQVKLDITRMLQISKEVFKENRFIFTIEAENVEEYNTIRKKITKQIKEYIYITYTKLLNLNTSKKKDDLKWDRCCAIGLSIEPRGEISFCNGPACEVDEFQLHSLTINSDNKLLHLIIRFKLQKLLSYLQKKHHINRQFEYPCDFCHFLAKNKNYINELYEHFIKD